jgi:hypothetical protein
VRAELRLIRLVLAYSLELRDRSSGMKFVSEEVERNDLNQKAVEEWCNERNMEWKKYFLPMANDFHIL